MHVGSCPPDARESGSVSAAESSSAYPGYWGGTGLLLSKLAERFPSAELTGVDASPSMLEQAQHALGTRPHVHLVQAELGLGENVSPPFAPATFDIITCTNTLHYFSDP